MKRTLRILKYTGVTVAALAGSAIAYLYARQPDSAPAARIRIEPTAERLVRGKYLYTLADCDGCHSERDTSRFGGPVVAGRQGVGTVFPKEMGLPGVVAPPNITPDRETGIGAWTDGEKIRAIREGVDRNGRTLFPMMPYEGYRHMSDEDVCSLVVCLDSLPPVKHQVPPTQLNFPVGLFIKSAPKPAGHVAAPDIKDRNSYGEYLVTIAGCRECHTPALSGGTRSRHRRRERQYQPRPDDLDRPLAGAGFCGPVRAVSGLRGERFAAIRALGDKSDAMAHAGTIAG